MFLLYWKKSIRTSFSPYKNLLGVLLIFLIATSFNITKAIHIDDTAFLEIARHIEDQPFRPMSGLVNWRDTAEPIHYLLHPPFMPYYYGAIISLFGQSEIILHLFFSLFTLGATFFFFSLARQFIPQYSFLLTAAFILGPAVLPSQNLMTDIPLVTMWLSFFWLLISPNSLTDTKRFFLAALVIGLSSLVKYVSLILIPILSLALIVKKKWHLLWLLGIPIAILLAWSLFNFVDYGGIHLLGPNNNPIYFSAVVDRFIVWLITLGAVSPFSLMFIPYLLKRKAGAFFILSTLVVTEVLAFLNWQYTEPIIDYWLRKAFFANGILVFGLTVYFIRDFLFLAWFIGASIFLILYVPFMAVRHIIVVLPLVLLVIGRGISGKIGRGWVYGGVLTTIVLGFLLGVSDWVYADLNRKEAKRIGRHLALLKTKSNPSSSLWFGGHWGFQWYANGEGLKQYDTLKSQLVDGDLLVVPKLFSQRISFQHALYLKTLASEVIESNLTTTVRPMTNWPYNGAGFYYLPSAKVLPWTISFLPLEEYTLYQYVAR